MGLNRRIFVAVAVASVFATATATIAETVIPDDVRDVLRENCLDCHDVQTAEGGVGISAEHVDWSRPGTIETWEEIHNLLTRRIMPPADMEPLSDEEIEIAGSWIDAQLMRHSAVGGTLLRRLSRREYRNTIAAIFSLPDFELPDTFPADNAAHGFDNQAAALVLSSAHLEAISQSAGLVADQFFPPPRPAVEPSRTELRGEDLTISYSSAMLADDGMRLASSGNNLTRNSTWPTRFEAAVNGRYRIELTASSRFPADAENLPRPEIEIGTRSNRKSSFSSDRKARQMVTLENTSGSPQTFRLNVDLDRGDTITLRYANGPFSYDDKTRLEAFLTQQFAADPKLAAAWDAVGNPARGGKGWDRVKDQWRRDDLDVAAYAPGTKKVTDLIRRLVKKSVDTGETLVFKYFEQGPYVAIERMTIDGPTEIYPDQEHTRRAAQRRRLLGDFVEPLTGDFSEDRADSVRTAARNWITPLLTKSLRRDVMPSESKAYVDLILRQSATTGRIDDGLHLAIRALLVSPEFLYRDFGVAADDPSMLNSSSLASRLSYFLTSDPPDQRLADAATRGDLFDSHELESQTRRLSDHPAFAKDFTRQWLGLSSLDSLMPDPRLMANFKDSHRSAMIDEVRQTFAAVLNENRPAVDLIAPDFVLTSREVARDIYALDQPGDAGKKDRDGQLFRYAVDRDANRGGLLCMPALMMATANGVDTQPVLRGVWVLENILGSPPPDPPDAVPALTPDTTGASTVKERLAAHMADDSCAACHREIDPIGFALENFDPIGRWRDHYPLYVEAKGKNASRIKRIDGDPVDATGTLPSGQAIRDVRDLKRILLADPKPFVCCLSEKWMTYATGRTLNHRERAMVARIVETQRDNDYRLADLLVALVDSPILRRR